MPHRTQNQYAMQDGAPMDSFFFPTSPMFANPTTMTTTIDGQQIPHQQQFPQFPLSVQHQPDLLFMAPDQPVQKNLPMPVAVGDGSVTSTSFLPLGTPMGFLPIPGNSRQCSAYDWSRIDVPPIQVEDVCGVQDGMVDGQGRSVSYNSEASTATSASTGSDDEDSGSSTPTFVPSSSPVSLQQQQQYQQLQQQQQGNINHAQSLMHLPLNSVGGLPPQMNPLQQMPLGRGLSLLEQFNCTIPDQIMETTDRTIVKVKRDRAPKRAVVVKKEQQQQQQKSSAAASSSAPIFVANTTIPAHGHATRVATGTVQPQTISENGYNSDGSQPSVQHTSTRASRQQHHSSQQAENDEENNEPSAGDDEDTKRRKLSRKAELARLARKRKKTRLGDLEAEVQRLEEELARVKRGRMTTTPAELQEPDLANAAKMDKAVQDMVMAVHSGLVARTAQAHAATLGTHRSPSLTGSDAVSRSSPTALTPLIDEFMVAYNGQQVSCAKHLENMQNHHLKPMRCFEFLSWLMKQPHESTNSMWATLLGRELHLSPNSREFRELECFRTSMSSQHNFDGEIERTFTKMCQLFTKRATQHSKNLNRIRSILDEQQFTQLIEWMSRNKQSMTTAPHVSMQDQ